MIYDCFTFFNELDLLEIRLNTLAGVVDKFVLVEATETFSGNPKPLYFQDNMHRYEEFLKKIIYVPIEDLPKTNNFWAREGSQRNSIALGLIDAQPNDIILISDVDEIPRPESLQYIASSGVTIFVQDYYMYYLNMRSPDEALWFLGTRAIHRRDFVDAQDARNWGAFRQPLKNKYCIYHGGWHFSYLGGPKAVQYKLESTSESQLPGGIVSDYDNIDSITRRIKLGKDVLGVRNHVWNPVPLDNFYPKYILEHQDRFADLIFGSDGAK
jgi:beta-1,4-mannosyl-glycoprotein beta-1,4-N-acetylglucosaminyltransferase